MRQTKKLLLVLDFDGTLAHPWWQGFSMAYWAIMRIFKKTSGLKLKRSVGLEEIVYEIFCNCRTYIYPEVRRILPLIAAKYRLAILTNRSRHRTLQDLGELRRYFIDVVGKEDVDNPKPSPEGMCLILCRTDYNPQEILFVGDTAVDIIAGQRAGVQTGFVAWGLGDPKIIRQLRPTYVLKKPADLLEISLGNGG